ncbi:hypothetical protein HZY91_04870 [Facklamia sp. DSM 111018]|uniref:Uncharacterized protein n=1 Tax=Facklamia lactis TaxID=2749967 RepID=A0ABS0LPZ3_9LACT|nr:hypothetical protein [Facklamia lactis]MBG9986223.1 hypothetical protein [Facklamia lactis]
MAKRVKNNKKPQKNIKLTKTPLHKQDVIISFSYPNWIKGFKIKDFTTFTKDENEFVNNFIYIMYELIPYVYENWGDRRFGHCHSINELKGKRTEEARNKYISFIKTIHSEIFSSATESSQTDSKMGKDESESIEYQTGQLEDLDLYQIGLNGSVRVICGKVDNILYPLLIDHYHLGYDSQHYNSDDTSKYNYCPIESRNGNC